MPKLGLVSRSFLHALAVALYVAGVVCFMTSMERVFQGVDEPGTIAPMTFLMLFVLSAAIVGVLMFAKPVMMFLEGQKKDAVKMAGYTIMWFALLTVISMIAMFGRI